MSSHVPPPNKRSIKKIVFFTISIDSQDPVLAQTLDWIKGLAIIYEEVHVFALHLNEFVDAPKNVSLLSFGGRNFFAKLIGIMRAYKRLVKLLEGFDTVVFYHMATWPLIFFGPIVKIKRAKQGLWYSHHHADLPLRLTNTLVNKYFSPTTDAFPLKDKSKLVTSGHSLDFTGLPGYREKGIEWSLEEIYCIGRITPVKRIELLLEALTEINALKGQKITVFLMGPLQNEKYLESLRRIALKAKLDLKILKPLQRKELFVNLKKVKFIFNGTPKSVDKSVLEACASGSIPITDNPDVMKLTGADSAWRDFLIREPGSIAEQVTYLMQATNQDLIEMSACIQKSTRVQNDFHSTLRSIKRELS